MNSRTSAPSRWQTNTEMKRGRERSRAGTSLRARIGILLAIWVCALVPLFFIRTEWFGRPLSDQQIGEYLHAERPGLVIHALTQIGDRMARHDPSVKIWYADLIRLARHPSPEVRALDAAIMGNDPSPQSFREALKPLLDDGERLVQFRAALALARFGDSSGRAEIVGGLQSWVVIAPATGRVKESAHLGGWVRQLAVIARIDSEEGTQEVVAPVNGRISATALKAGDTVQSGSEMMQIDPAPDVVGDVLAALARVGGAEDLAVVDSLEVRPNLPDRVRQQATLTARAIRARIGQPQMPASPLHHSSNNQAGM